jgi:hypothetical protein
MKLRSILNVVFSVVFLYSLPTFAQVLEESADSDPNVGLRALIKNEDAINEYSYWTGEDNNAAYVFTGKVLLKNAPQRIINFIQAGAEPSLNPDCIVMESAYNTLLVHGLKDRYPHGNLRFMFQNLLKTPEPPVISDRESIYELISLLMKAKLIYEVARKGLLYGNSEHVKRLLNVVANGKKIKTNVGTITYTYQKPQAYLSELYPYGENKVKGYTPLELAVKNEHPKCLKIMLDATTEGLPLVTENAAQGALHMTELALADIARPNNALKKCKKLLKNFINKNYPSALGSTDTSVMPND